MFHRPKHLQRPHVEEYVVREIQPVVTHYVTNKSTDTFINTLIQSRL